MHRTLEAIADHTPAVIAAKSLDGRFTYVNREFERLFRISQEQVLGKTNYDVVAPEVADYFSENDKKVLASGVPERFEEKMLVGEELRTYSSIKFPLRDSSGVIYGLAIIATDIIHQKHLEDERQIARELAEALNTINGLIHSTLDFDDIMNRVVNVPPKTIGTETFAIGLFEGSDYVVKYPCDVLKEMAGLRFPLSQVREAGIASARKDVVVLSDPQEAKQLSLDFTQKLGIRVMMAAPLIIEEEVIGLLNFYYREPGIPATSPLIDFAKKLAASISLAIKNARLFEQAKRSERALRASEIRLQTILESTPGGIIVTDAAGSFIFRNKLADALFGGQVTGTAYGPKGGYTLHRPDGSPFPPDDLPLPRVLRGESTQDTELVIRYQNGEEKTILTFARPVLNASGELSGAVASMLDITERKLAEQQMKMFIDLINQSNDAVLVVDLATRLNSMVNDKLCRDLQYTREELLAMRPEDISTKPPGFFDSHFQELREIGTVLVDDHHRRRDGSTFPVEVNVKYTEMNHQEFAVAVIRDISERRHLEQELQKAHRLESIGLLAGGIAHDFNNILTTILGNIELAKIFLPRENERSLQRLTTAEQAAARARGITQQLLTFAKGGAPIKNRAFVPKLIHDLVVFARRGGNVNCDCSFPADLWFIEVDENQMRQVINNLVMNACQAMPEEGTLTVSAKNEIIEPDNPLDLNEGKYVRIDFTDQGVGIPEEHLGMIFDPYFTTKERGSGLGLAISYSIIKRHGGTITVSSVPGEGSTFSLFLPASEAKDFGPEALQD